MAKSKPEEGMEIRLDDMPDSKQYRSIDTAGIHRGFTLHEIQFQVREQSKDKDGKPKVDKEDNPVMIGPWMKLTFRKEETTEQIVVTVFAPPAVPEDVKFVGKKYVDGVAVRDLTKEEQIHKEFENKYYLFEQLGKALLVSPEKFKSFRSALTGSTTEMFKKMYDKFFSLFPLDTIKNKAIDIKMLWNNNDKAKTSFLQLASPGSSNLVFAPYIPERGNSTLSISQFESSKATAKPKYDRNARAPQGDAPVIGGTGNEWKPVKEGGDDDSNDTDTGGDDPLF